MNEMRRLINLVEDAKPRLLPFLRAVVDVYNSEVAENGPPRVYAKGPGFRVWTRGDGVRHRDPAKVLVYDDKANTKEEIESFWQWLQNRGARPIGKVTGEFGSSSADPAVSYQGFIWVQREYSIAVMSRSRITNPNSVWRLEK